MLLLARKTPAIVEQAPRDAFPRRELHSYLIDRLRHPTRGVFKARGKLVHGDRRIRNERVSNRGVRVRDALHATGAAVQVTDTVWLVGFMQYDLGFFDHEADRVTSAETLSAQSVYRCARNQMMWRSQSDDSDREQEMIGKFKRLCRKLAVAREVLSLADLRSVEAPEELRELISTHDAASRHLPDAYTLDIGCGSEPANPFRAKYVFGVDIRANEDERIRYADLITEPIPFPDRYFDYVTAHDFIEHVPRVIYAPGRRFPFVQLMNEIWRTLKPGGIFLSRTPAYPFSPAFRDPTHVNIITHETFPLYFGNEYRRGAIYGFSGSFKILDQAVKPPHLISLLQRSG